MLLHGEPTWGYLYRNMIGPLPRHHRVIVPDQMGFGKSETPQDREYSLRSHTENLDALIGDLGLRDVTFFGQDWAGLIVTAYAARNPDRVKRLFYANTLNGHAQGASGAMEAAVCALALKNRAVPPLRNLATLSEDCAKLDYVVDAPREAPDLDTALSANLGFGGHNTAIVFQRA